MSRFNKPISPVTDQKKQVQIELFPQRIWILQLPRRCWTS